MKHLTSIQLEEYIDHTIDESAIGQIELHIRVCVDCRDRLERFQQIERSLKRIPPERVSANFTERVMQQLGVQRSLSVAWSVFKILAPLFAMALVVGIVYLVLQISGAFVESGIGQSVEATKSIYNEVSDGMANCITTFNGWMKTFFPFLYPPSAGYERTSYGLVAFVVLFFGAVGLLDKFIFMPMVRRRL